MAEVQNYNNVNQILPSGYYIVPPSKNTIFWEPPKTSNPELNFNDFKYFIPSPETGIMVPVKEEVLRAIVFSPESPWEENLKAMVMISEDGKSKPIHLPNIVALVGIVKLPSTFWKLEKWCLDYSSSCAKKLVPSFLEKIADPTPDLKFEGPVYSLGLEKVQSVMGSFTDGLQIFYSTDRISSIDYMIFNGRDNIMFKYKRFMTVRLEPEYVPGLLEFPIGCCIIVWNTRGVSRPSFVENLARLICLHHPTMVILTEVRVSKIHAVNVANSFGNSMNWEIVESIGLSGGIIVIWDTLKSTAKEVHIKGSNKLPILMTGGIVPVRVVEEGGPCIDDQGAVDEDGMASFN